MKQRETAVTKITSLADFIFPKPERILLSLMCQDQKLGNISKQIFKKQIHIVALR